MIIAFSQTFPTGAPTLFWEKILAGIGRTYLMTPEQISEWEIAGCGIKIHTIREGQRWKEGQKMHIVHNLRKKSYTQLNKGMDCLQECVGVQRIDIFNTDGQVHVYIDSKPWLDIKELAENDGLTRAQFQQWFSGEQFHGQIIHFTNLKYQ